MKTNILILIPILLFSFSQLHPETYNVKSFGAVGDGKTLNTQSIQKAINKCRDNGGGTVLIPQGVFILGTIRLFDNINLNLESGAVLKGSGKLSDYYLNGKKLGLIYTENSGNVSITGEGEIDGSGDVFMNLNKTLPFDSASVMYTRQKIHFRQVLTGIGDGPVIALDRPFQMIIFSNCKNVSVRNVLISNSPFWTLHLADCDGALITGVKVWNNLLIPNNDGFDFTSCSNVLVSDCDIRTGDDAIAITGYAYHFDLPGYKNLKHDSENITVTNCSLVSRSSAIRIGGWDQNNMRNYTFSNIVISNSNRGIDLCVRDEGSVEDMTFTNITLQTRLHTGNWWGNGEPIHISAIRGKEKVTLGHISNIKFDDILANGESGILLYCSSESKVENITFSNISLNIKNSALNKTGGGNFDLRPVTDAKYALFSHTIPAFYAENVSNIQLHNLNISWDNVEEDYFTYGVEFSNFDNVFIDGCTIDPACPPVPSGVGKPACRTGKPAPNNPYSSIALENGKRYRIRDSYPDNPKIKWLIKKNVDKK